VSMTLLLVAQAFAGGTAVWLSGTPDPSFTPGYTLATPEDVAPDMAWSVADSRAVEALRSELRATLPLKDVFDGELQIMRRLQSAVADVHAIRPEDREVLWEALLFEGYAVHRYFQSGIATEAAAAPYRVELGDGAAGGGAKPGGPTVEIAAWLDAVALDPDRIPTTAEIPDQAELLAFQEARARHLLAPEATIVADGLPEGSALWVDGRVATVDRMQVPPGHHRVVIIDSSGVIRVRAELDLRSGQVGRLPYLATAAELRALAGPLAERPRSLPLAAPVVGRLGALEAPVLLMTPGRKQPHRFTLEGSAAVFVDPTSGAPTKERLGLRVGVGAGWFYDGNFLLGNQDQGAPETIATVNATAPLLLAEAELRLGPLWMGGGVDAALPLGEHHTLPVGSEATDTRLRLYPHVLAGIAPVQLTAGWLFPYHLGVGVRGHLPLPGPLEISGGYTHGFGVDRAREDGSTYDPGRVQTAWLAAGARFGLGGVASAP
jgi:hypothetical protein